MSNIANSALQNHPNYSWLAEYDRFAPYIEEEISSGIRKNRMGTFSLRFTDENGEPIAPDSVSAVQLTHEFKFGSTLFLVDQFPEEEKNRKFRDLYCRLFNYGIVPIYWDALEPKEGHYRYEKDSEPIWRRPPIDTAVEFARENGIRMKAHCLAYNSFNPDWLSKNNREINVSLDRRIRSFAERYTYDFEDMDVINEMISIYKNCYPGNGCRNFQITDEYDHEKRCFDRAKHCFPETRLFWNEGIHETFDISYYRGTRSNYFMMLKNRLAEGCQIEGIGMQFHAYIGRGDNDPSKTVYFNPLRTMDIFDCYEKFDLPIHLSEVSIPSWSNSPDDELFQAEVVRRMYRLWFSRKNVEAIIWWNPVDGCAYKSESKYCTGLLHQDLSEKLAYKELRRLIFEEWHTEEHFSEKKENYIFKGFYGDYLIKAEHNGRLYEKKVRLFRDTTGYDNRLMDFRPTEIILS